MVSLPAVSTGSVAAAHASAEADGATEGAVVAAALDAVGPVVGAAADGLAPPLVHAVARIANRPRVKVIVLRTSCFLPGCWDARECTCGVPGMPKRRGRRPSRDGAGWQHPVSHWVSLVPCATTLRRTESEAWVRGPQQ